MGKLVLPNRIDIHNLFTRLHAPSLLIAAQDAIIAYSLKSKIRLFSKLAVHLMEVTTSMHGPSLSDQRWHENHNASGNTEVKPMASLGVSKGGG